MQQAGYNADSVRALNAAFEKANPDTKAIQTVVTYEALHGRSSQLNSCDLACLQRPPPEIQAEPRRVVPLADRTWMNGWALVLAGQRWLRWVR
ncbi:hypothetical protein [Streptomyces sp. NPDC001348]